MKTQPHILIIESDAAMIDLIQDTLSPPYNLFTAQDALEGTDLLLTERLDLLIIDALLPVLSGAELIRIIRADPPFSRIPIIAFPAYSDKLCPLDPALVQAILPKPFSIDALARTVAQTLARANGHRRMAQGLKHPLAVGLILPSRWEGVEDGHANQFSRAHRGIAAQLSAPG